MQFHRIVKKGVKKMWCSNFFILGKFILEKIDLNKENHNKWQQKMIISLNSGLWPFVKRRQNYDICRIICLVALFASLVSKYLNELKNLTKESTCKFGSQLGEILVSNWCRFLPSVRSARETSIQCVSLMGDQHKGVKQFVITLAWNVHPSKFRTRVNLEIHLEFYNWGWVGRGREKVVMSG